MKKSNNNFSFEDEVSMTLSDILTDIDKLKNEKPKEKKVFSANSILTFTMCLITLIVVLALCLRLFL